jgi:hypothetical protein
MWTRRREQRGSAEARPLPRSPQGNRPSGLFMHATAPFGMEKGATGEPAPLHKGASGMSTQSQPLNGGVSPPGLAT